jgi:hypothetical protein
MHSMEIIAEEHSCHKVQENEYNSSLSNGEVAQAGGDLLGVE